MNLIQLFDYCFISAVDTINKRVGYRPVLRALMVLSVISLIFSAFTTSFTDFCQSIAILGVLGLEFLYDSKVSEDEENGM